MYVRFSLQGPWNPQVCLTTPGIFTLSKSHKLPAIDIFLNTACTGSAHTWNFHRTTSCRAREARIFRAKILAAPVGLLIRLLFVVLRGGVEHCAVITGATLQRLQLNIPLICLLSLGAAALRAPFVLDLRANICFLIKHLVMKSCVGFFFFSSAAGLISQRRERDRHSLPLTSATPELGYCCTAPQTETSPGSARWRGGVSWSG